MSQASSVATLQSQISAITHQVQALTSRNNDDVSTLSGSLVGGCNAAGQHRQNQINKVRVINSVQHASTPTVQHSNPNFISTNETDTKC